MGSHATGFVFILSVSSEDNGGYKLCVHFHGIDHLKKAVCDLDIASPCALITDLDPSSKLNLAHSVNSLLVINAQVHR